MAPLKLLSLAGAALLLVQLPFCSGDGDPPKADPANCLGEMNKQRQGAGLGDFKQADEGEGKLIVKTGDSPEYGVDLEEVCGGKIAPATDKSLPEGTFMLFKPGKGGKANCQDAVKSWEEAGKTFSSGPPPNYQGDKEAPYNDMGVRSFVGMFSPAPDASAECIYVTCKKGDDSDSADSQSDASGVLLCAAYPTALTSGSPPFQEQVWTKIHSSINGSTPVSTTAALSFVLAASVLSSVFRL